MSLTDKYLELERQNFNGVQRIYKFPSGYGLSLVNASILHSYPYAWEAAVIDPEGNLSFETTLTDGVEVFESDSEANAFIERAAREIGGQDGPHTREVEP